MPLSYGTFITRNKLFSVNEKVLSTPTLMCKMLLKITGVAAVDIILMRYSISEIFV